MILISVTFADLGLRTSVSMLFLCCAIFYDNVPSSHYHCSETARMRKLLLFALMLLGLMTSAQTSITNGNCRSKFVIFPDGALSLKSFAMLSLESKLA